MIRWLLGLFWEGPPDPMLDDTGQPLIKPPRVLHGAPDWALINKMGAKKWRETCEAQGKQRRTASVLRIARDQ